MEKKIKSMVAIPMTDFLPFQQVKFSHLLFLIFIEL